MPSLDGLKVVRSSIHGYGVVTLRPFKRGDIIVYGDGVVYSEDDDFDDTYALLLAYAEEDEEDGRTRPQLLLDLTDQTRWINHACDPNTEVDTSWDERTRAAYAWWVALRDIPAGEELSYDYAFSAPLAEPCSCGMTRCRGLIVDEAELHLVTGEYKKLIRLPYRGKKRRRRA